MILVDLDVKEESANLHSKLLLDGSQLQIDLPIRRLYNIPVEVTLVFKPYHVYLRIVYKDAPAQRIYLLELQSTITVDDIHSVLTNLPTTFQNIKYEPYCCFYVEPKNDKLFAQLVQNIPHVECKFGECTVCYAITRYQTPCKHYLCYQCDTTISDEAYRIFKPFPMCPICRQDIS